IPEEQFAWGSQSTRRILMPWRARQAARLMAVVVLPTPPFWLTRPRIFPMAIQSKAIAVRGQPPELWRTKQTCGKPSLEDEAKIRQTSVGEGFRCAARIG